MHAQIDNDFLQTSEVLNIISVLNDAIKNKTVIHDVPAVKQKSFSSACVKAPKLKMLSFSDNKIGPFSFYKFLSVFMNTMESLPDISNRDKFCYLKSYVQGKAFSMIENLPVNDCSFELALSLLKDEFLDKEFLINSVFSKITSVKPCVNLEENMEFVSLLKCKLQELKSLECTVESEEKFGLSLISHIVRARLFPPLLEEVVRKTNQSYPSVLLINSHANVIFRMLQPRDTAVVNKAWGYKENRFGSMKVPYSKSYRDVLSENKNCNIKADKIISIDKGKNEKSSSVFNGFASNAPKKGCRFCGKDNHSSLH